MPTVTALVVAAGSLAVIGLGIAVKHAKDVIAGAESLLGPCRRGTDGDGPEARLPVGAVGRRCEDEDDEDGLTA